MKFTILVDPFLVIITIHSMLNFSYTRPSVYKKRRNMAFSLHVQHKNPCPGGHEIYKFVRPSLDFYYFILNFSDPYPYPVYTRRGEPHLNTRILTQGVMKITTLVDPSLGVITMYLVCLNHSPY